MPITSEPPVETETTRFGGERYLKCMPVRSDGEPVKSRLTYSNRVFKSGDVVEATPDLLKLCEPSKSGITWFKEVSGEAAQGAEEAPPVPRGMKMTPKGVKAMSQKEMKAALEGE
jgi:hypothetical protein